MGGTEITSNKNGSLTYKKEGVKNKPGRKPVYIHKCSEKVQLERMRVILVGNGDPKTGLAFKMEKSIDDISEIKTTILDIKDKLNETIIAASTAASSLEKYKLEVKSFENGKEDAEEKAAINRKNEEDKIHVAKSLALQKNRDMWYKIFTIIGLAIAIYFGVKNNKIPEQLESAKQEINTRIKQQEGISKVTRSGYVKYNDQGLSDSVKIKRYN